MWFTGIDWADTHHDIVVLTETGQTCLQLHVAHTATGITELITRLRKLTGPDHLEEMICVLETKAGLLVTALLEAGFALYPINPKTTDRWRPASGAKSDVTDACILAKVARSDWQQLTRLRLPVEAVQQLTLLVHDQEALIKERSRMSNQLKAALKLYYPAVLAGLTTDMTQKSLLAFLHAYPTPQLAQQASCEQLTALFKACHNSHATASAQRLWQELHQPMLQANTATENAKSEFVLSLVPSLQLLIERIAHYSKLITSFFEQQQEHELFESLPAAGKRLGPRLLVGLTAFEATTFEAKHAQQIAGTAPVTKQSGKSRQVVQRQACDKSLRNTLYQYSLQTLKQVPWARAYYEEKVRQGKKNAAALRSLSNIWIRIIWAMRRTQSPYDEATFVQAQKNHGSRAA
jgi:transposase